MEMIEFAAEPRVSLGSGAARRFRRSGSVPAVLYGKGSPVPILVDGRALEKVTTKGAGRNLIFKIAVREGAEETAIIRNIQRNPVSRKVSHVDFLRILLTEKITTNVHIELTGASEAVKLGAILMSLTREIQVRALPLDIPEKITADISVLGAIGDSLHVSDLKVPSNIEIVTAGSVTLAAVQAPQAEEAPTAAATAEATAAEGAVATAEGAAPAAAAEAKPGEKPKGAEKGKPAEKSK